MKRHAKALCPSTEQNKCKTIFDSWIKQQHVCDPQSILSKQANNISRQKTELAQKHRSSVSMPVRKFDNGFSSPVLQDSFINDHEEKPSPPSPASVTAKRCYLDEQLRVNEMQIKHLQQRINQRNGTKLASYRNVSQHDFMFCRNDSLKITNTGQQYVLQQCQFPCVISKTALMIFLQDGRRNK